MVGIIIVMLVFFGIVGGVIFFLIRMLNKAKEDVQVDYSGADNPTDGSKMTSAQNFIPIKDIRDSMVDLGNHQYRLYIECNSINIYLKSEYEQQIVEASFQKFLHSVRYPYAFYVQTREIDNRAVVRNMERDIKASLQVFPQLSHYADQYLASLNDLDVITKNSKTKKKYVIITYDEADAMTELNDAEKRKHAFSELFTRANTIMSGLAGVGVTAKVLKTSEVAEVIYRSINKDKDSACDGIISGEYFESIVSAPQGTTLESKPVDIVMGMALDEAINVLETYVMNNKASTQQQKDEALLATRGIRNIKNKLQEDREKRVLGG